MQAAIRGSMPPETEIECAITDAAHSTIESPIPSATAPANGIRRRGR